MWQEASKRLGYIPTNSTTFIVNAVESLTSKWSIHISQMRAYMNAEPTWTVVVGGVGYTDTTLLGALTTAVLDLCPAGENELRDTRTECDLLREEVESWKSHFAVLSRVCHNWREWPRSQPEATPTEYDHKDWQAGARAIIERDKLEQEADKTREVANRAIAHLSRLHYFTCNMDDRQGLDGKGICDCGSAEIVQQLKDMVRNGT